MSKETEKPELIIGQEYFFKISQEKVFVGRFLGQTQVRNFPETYVFEDDDGYAFVRNITVRDGRVVLSEKTRIYHESHQTFDSLSEDSSLVQMVNNVECGI